MNSPSKALPKTQMTLDSASAPADRDAVLAREAGLPFQSPAGSDPITQWLSLMEVVQMLCPEWPVRSSSMAGKHWRL